MKTGPMPTIDDCDPWPPMPGVRRGKPAARHCESCDGSGFVVGRREVSEVESRAGLQGIVRRRCPARCVGGSLRLRASAAIVEHACERVALPRIPGALLCERVVEILAPFSMDGDASDEWTGLRGAVLRVHADGDCEVETARGEVSVASTRLKTIGMRRVRDV